MPGPPLRVLVVEDNPADARLAEWTLSHEPEGPYESLRADRVAAAVARLATERIDAVLLDRGLPDSHDLAGIRALRARAPDVAVLLLSGAEDPDLTPRSIGAGAQDHLVKGIFPSGVLGDAVRRSVARQQVESCVGRTGAPLSGPWTDLSSRGVAGAIIDRERVVDSNEQFGRWAGPSSGPGSEVPEDLRPLLRLLPPSGGAESGAATFLPSTDPSIGIVLAVVRLLPTPIGPRHLVWLWERGPPRAPAPTPRERVRPLDVETWTQLREMARTDPEFLPNLVATFHVEAGRLVRLLQTADARGDAAGLARIAHQLKSTCAQLGAHELAARCAELERGVSDAALRSATVRRVVRDLGEVERAVDAELAAK